MSGSEPSRRIQSSGAGMADGMGGPMPTPASTAAFMIGTSIGKTNPKPNVKVSRSRRVIGRLAGTVSSSGPSNRLRTLRSASSGSSRSTGSSSRSLHSSTRIIAAAAVTGLVMEEMRKIESRCIGCAPSYDMPPIASTCASPRRLTSDTSPATSRRST
jgi:hypothetical protein